MSNTNPITATDAGFTTETGTAILIQNALIKLMKKLNDASRDALTGIPESSSVTINNPEGIAYGKITRSTARYTAELTNPELVAEEHPEYFRDTINPDCLDDIIALIKEHGDPNTMLSQELDPSISDTLHSSVITYARENGKSPEGWKVNAKPGVIAVRPSPLADDAARAYARSVGMIDDDNTTI